MSNGNELERILTVLLELCDNDAFDYVVIETSGLTNMTSLLQTLFRIQTASARYYLDGVICMVDAKHCKHHLTENSMFSRSKEMHSQLAYADVVCINKTDLVGEDQLEQTVAAIQQFNSSASHLFCQYGDVPLGQILDVHAFDVNRTAWTHPTTTDNNCSHSNHSTGVGTMSLTTEAKVNMSELQEWLQTTLSSLWPQLFRVKGILYIAGRSTPFVLQGVHADIHGAFTDIPEHQRPACSELVLIGRDLPEEMLRSQFLACCTSSESAVTSDVPSNHSNEVRKRHHQDTNQ